MSAKATFWAWDQPLRAPDKLVLLCLADNHNGDTGRCNPSLTYISKKTGLDRKTVMRSIPDLEKMGLLTANKSFGRSTVYHLKTSTNFGTASATENSDQTSTENGTGQQAEKASSTGAKNGTSTKTGTGTKNGTQPVPKTGLEPVPKTGHEPTDEPKKNLLSESAPPFPMESDWRPTERFWRMLEARNKPADFFTEEGLCEFRDYWVSKPGRCERQEGWEAKLVSSLDAFNHKRKLRDEQLAKVRGADARRSDLADATTGSTRDDWAENFQRRPQSV